MKPFFSYFGSKARVAKLYGPPRYADVIEPFAGSASYSVYWEPERVLLVDCDPVIIETWRYLISARPADILALPTAFETTDTLDIPDGAKHLIGFWLNKASSHPSKKPGNWARQYQKDGQCHVWSQSVKERIAAQVPKIRHWEAICGSYAKIAAVPAHWFVDAPYVGMGHRYRFSEIDYGHLAGWCKQRPGFVQVCENDAAHAWLPFQRLAEVRGMLRRRSTEMVYEYGAASNA